MKSSAGFSRSYLAKNFGINISNGTNLSAHITTVIIVVVCHPREGNAISFLSSSLQ